MGTVFNTAGRTWLLPGADIDTSTRTAVAALCDDCSTPGLTYMSLFEMFGHMLCVDCSVKRSTPKG